MRKFSVAALLFCLLAPIDAAGKNPVEVTELWTGSLFTSTYRVGLCFSSLGTIRGVVHLRLKNGKVDVYHIKGTVNGNKIKASHSSGHKFKGELVGSDRVKGSITLKSGLRIELDGRREHDAPLAPEDCAPLASPEQSE